MSVNCVYYVLENILCNKDGFQKYVLYTSSFTTVKNGKSEANIYSDLNIQY